VALGRIVELGEAEAVLGEGVEVGRFDFRAVAADVGEAEVIGHDDDDVWGCWSGRFFAVLKFELGLGRG